MADFNDLISIANELKTEIAGIRNGQAAMAAARSTGAIAIAGGTPSQAAAAPHIRYGNSPFSSKGFSFGNFLAAMGNGANSHYYDHAKNELAFAQRFTKAMCEKGYIPDRKDGLLVPVWPDGLNHEMVSNEMYHETKCYIQAGVDKTDPDEVSWYSKKMLSEPGFLQTKAAATPAQSWIDQTLMGSFVPPPTFGPPIELLRNKEALMNAGATVVPLGPSGRITFPRLTGATQGGWSGENTQQTPTTAQTGALNLSAKKVISVVVLPNELLRFASPAAEVLIRNDMMKTVALIMDKGLLEGPGSSNQPLGIMTMATAGSPAPSAGTFTLSNAGVNYLAPSGSNELAPQDAYTFLAAIETANGDPDQVSWIMHPRMKYAWSQTRWTPYSSGTNEGGFVFDLTRAVGDKIVSVLAGRPIVATPQVSSTRGSGSQTYVIALQGDDYYIGMFAAIEFTQTDAGYTLLSSDQTAVRAVLECDGGPRHPALICASDALNFVVGP